MAEHLALRARPLHALDRGIVIGGIRQDHAVRQEIGDRGDRREIGNPAGGEDVTPTPRHTQEHIAHLVEAMVDVWHTLGIPFVEPLSHLHVDENSEQHCAYPGIKLAAQ